MPSGSPRLDWWERRTDWPLAAVAIMFLVAYAVDVLAQPSGAADRAVDLVTWGSWAVFAIDYLIRLGLATDRWRWFYRHLFDLAIVLLPLLRPLRLVRLVILITALHRAVGNAIRGRVVVYTVAAAVLLVFVASLAVLDSERHVPDAHITDFGEALWWSVTTITTVGYGDLTPITTEGRVIAALLMIGGISLVGSITATLASWIVQRVADEQAAEEAVTTAHINRLVSEIGELRSEVRRLGGETDPDRPDG
ncbi:potassium channel family protein [Mycobacterium deserti]|uniref:Potassium channel family protein n=1 Tax=Mycobacterium deserti TaxID=2978347 RepID=A0ABT2M5K0_9MYCO|nr:potassium channel family protein [Mycobacterium deserti]MCT7657547.1 potassium channel family protein [Mycobacterium deserti]